MDNKFVWRAVKRMVLQILGVWAVLFVLVLLVSGGTVQETAVGVSVFVAVPAAAMFIRFLFILDGSGYFAQRPK